MGAPAAARNQRGLLPSLRNGLAGYWPCARDGAVDLRDYGPNGLLLTNNGAIVKATAGLSPAVEAAQLVLASTKFFSVANPAALKVGTGSWYISCWCKFDTISGVQSAYPMSFEGAAGNLAWAIQCSTAAPIRGLVYDTDGTTLTGIAASAVTPAAGIWYFIEVWADYQARLCYCAVNLGPAGSATYNGGPAAPTANLNLGALNNTANTYLDGQLANCGMWKRTLSMPERVWLYNHGQGRDLRRAA